MNVSPKVGTNSLIDLTEPKRIHVVGVGGTGMSALALVLNEAGHRISGSEIKDLSILKKLEANGIQVYKGQSADHVTDKDVVVYSTAIPKDNIEIVSAVDQSIPLRHRGEILGSLSTLKDTIGVAGTHGKSTITSLITLILHKANEMPSFVVGSEINEVGSSAGWDSGRYLVLEADESDGSFLHLKSYVGVVSSVEPDHLEYYGDFFHLQKAFCKFLSDSKIKVVGTGFMDQEESDMPLIGDGKNGNAKQSYDYRPTEILDNVVDRQNLYTVGFRPSDDFRIENVVFDEDGSKFSLNIKAEKASQNFEIMLYGYHNVYNAAVSAATAIALGIDLKAVKSALNIFGGISRRFEFRGVKNDITFIDDYAHLPGEIRPTVHAAKQLKKQRTIVVFQPHRYTRVKSIYRDFAEAFDEADVVYITDIYSAGEQPIPGISGELVYDVVKDHFQKTQKITQAYYISSRAELIQELLNVIDKDDIVLTLTAGDLTTLPDEIMERM